MDKPIASGVYKSRRPLQGYEHAWVVFGKRDNGKMSVYDKLPDVPFVADSIGLGFCLIKKEVIETMLNKKDEIGFPFDLMTIDDLKQDHNEVTNLVGEDIAFSHRARLAGFDVWVNPKALVGHCTTQVIT